MVRLVEQFLPVVPEISAIVFLFLKEMRENHSVQNHSGFLRHVQGADDMKDAHSREMRRAQVRSTYNFVPQSESQGNSVTLSVLHLGIL